MKYLRMCLPIVIVLLSVLGITVNYFNGNDVAFHAYVIATSGWLAIAADEIVTFLDNRKSNV